MAQPVWSFQLTDLTFTPVGEILNAANRQVSLGLNRVSAASFQIRLDNPLVPRIDVDLGYVKAYRNGVLMFFGPIVSTEEVGDRENTSMAVTAAGAPWILAYRLAGKTSAGFVQATARDRALIVKDLIDTANAENETHIDTSGPTISAASASTYQASPFKPVSECITDLAATLDGFDWAFDPRENFAAGTVTSQKIATFRAAPVLGTTRDARFEWGDGTLSNVIGYKRTLARETQANKVYHSVDQGVDQAGFPTVQQVDANSQAKWGLMEALAQADIIDNGLRQQLVNEHVRVRAQPRKVIEFTPHLDDGTHRVPTYGTDYAIGDSVHARAVFNHITRFDVLMRVWAASFNLDNEGMETITLTLSDDT